MDLNKETTCHRCGGKGFCKCASCNGSGIFYSQYTSDAEVAKYGGYPPCPMCKGAKEVTCYSCGGRGSIKHA